MDKYIATNRERLSEAYTFTTSFLDRQGIKYSPGSNAAFFLWVDLGSYFKTSHPEFFASSATLTSSDVEPSKEARDEVLKREIVEAEKDITGFIAERLLGKKVFLASGKAFGAEADGWFRIVFSHERKTLVEGLVRMLSAVGSPGEDLVLRLKE